MSLYNDTNVVISLDRYFYSGTLVKIDTVFKPLCWQYRQMDDYREPYLASALANCIRQVLEEGKLQNKDVLRLFNIYIEANKLEQEKKEIKIIIEYNQKLRDLNNKRKVAIEQHIKDLKRHQQEIQLPSKKSEDDKEDLEGAKMP